MSSYTEDHLVEQPAIQLMQHELGWVVVEEQTLNIELLTWTIEVKKRESLGGASSPALPASHMHEYIQQRF